MLPRLLLLVSVIAVSACAHLQPASPTAPPPPATEYIVPPGTEMVSEIFGYSQAARTGNWVTVSAQAGYDTERRGFPEAFEAQVQLAFKNLEAVLKHAGAEMGDVVEITTYQLDMSKFPKVVGARMDLFGPHRPAWTAVGVQALPMPSMQFQISARAYGPDRRKPAAAQPGDAAPKKEKPPQRFMNRPGY